MTSEMTFKKSFLTPDLVDLRPKIFNRNVKRCGLTVTPPFR